MVYTPKKSSTIRYRLGFKHSRYGKSLIEYLQRGSSCLDGRQQVEQIIEAFLLPLVLSPEDPNFKAVAVESLSRLKSQIEIIQSMTGISLASSYQPASIPAPTQFQSVVSERPLEVQANTESELSPLEELEATIDRFKQQLLDNIDPLVISQALTQIQPEEEESWTEEMWQIYDSFYEEVSQLEYQATFSPETGM